MKKLVGWMLCLALVLGCAGAQAMTDGTYTGTGTGMKGPVTVEVTVAGNRIEGVTVTEQSETFGLGYGMENTPVETVPQAIVEGQTLAVDMVTGATITTRAILAAAKDALTQAGADVDALSAAKEPAPAAADEEVTVDVVIAGAGAAGLAAGIEARNAGANVLIVEKQGIAGGATTRSGGKILAAGSEWQRKQGFEDDPQLMYDYLVSVGGEAIDEAKVRPFCENSVANMAWLEAMGVQIQDVEAIHSSLTPWRVHNVVGAGGMTDGHGGQFIVPMLNEYEKLGGEIVYNTAATTLLTDESGRVCGLVAGRADGSTLTVHANAVILATGGYAQNRELLNFPAVKGYYSSVPAGNVGDGLTMAAAVGGAVEVPDYTQVVYTSFTCGVGINEEAGLIVNDRGERFANEYSYQYHVGDQLAKTGSSCGYYIACPDDPNMLVLYGLSLDSTPKAESVEALAELIGVDPAVLSATVARYNELCGKGVDEDYGKPADKMLALNGPIYAAIKLSPAVTVTYGGIVTDEQARVLTADGSVVAGLYAAGETANVGLFGSEYPCCGMAIGSAVYFGRIAGGLAAAE